MAALSQSHRGSFLAVLIDGRVVCLHKIQEKMGAEIQIDGAFDARQADRLLRRLLAPPAGAGEDTDALPEEEDNQGPPATGGGSF